MYDMLCIQYRYIYPKLNFNSVSLPVSFAANLHRFSYAELHLLADAGMPGDDNFLKTKPIIILYNNVKNYEWS